MPGLPRAGLMTRRAYRKAQTRADLASMAPALAVACVPYLVALALLAAMPIPHPDPAPEPTALSFHLADPADESLPPGGGRPDHKRHIKPLPDVLDVVAVVSNPVRYRSRYDLFRAFEAHVCDAGARLTVVEIAYANRPFEVTERANPRHLQLRTDSEMWHKEAMVNLGVARLPRDSRYVAWVDADLTFARPDWVQETLQQLQHHPIVQMFEEAHDLGPDGRLINSFRSFASSHVLGVPRKPPAVAPPPAPIPGGKAETLSATVKSRAGAAATVTLVDPVDGYYGGYGRPSGGSDRIAYWHHPGYAWAARREALDCLGGLLDFAVVGESDYIMAKSFVGEAEDVLYPGVSPGYRKAVLDWQARAQSLRGDLGYVSGSVMHHWHGRKASRQYWSRCRILEQARFDPSTDLARDWQGLYRLVDDGTPRSLLLRDSIRAYFRSRNEDGLEL